MVVWKFPCTICWKPVRFDQPGVYCEACRKWSHCKCLRLSNYEYARLQRSEEGWCCPSCWTLPFSNCSHLSSSFNDSSNVSSASTEPSLTSFGTALSKSGLSIFYSNCRSILPKMADLGFVVSSTTPDIIALTETWLDQDIVSSEIAIPSYQLIRRDRSRHGGGICLYVRDSSIILSRFSHASIELLSIVLRTELGPLLVCLHYRPPSCDTGLCELEDALSSLDISTYSRTILLGDFNIDLLHESSSSMDLLGIAASFGLEQIITEPTRPASSASINSTLLDHVYSSHQSLISSHTVLHPLGSSDHNSILVCLTWRNRKSLHFGGVSGYTRRPILRRSVWLWNIPSQIQNGVVSLVWIPLGLTSSPSF